MSSLSWFAVAYWYWAEFLFEYEKAILLLKAWGLPLLLWWGQRELFGQGLCQGLEEPWRYQGKKLFGIWDNFPAWNLVWFGCHRAQVRNSPGLHHVKWSCLCPQGHAGTAVGAGADPAPEGKHPALGSILGGNWGIHCAFLRAFTVKTK